MSLKWTDGLGIARCLNNDNKYREQDLMILDVDTLENMIVESGITTAPVAVSGEARTNILNAIIWHWMRLRNEGSDMEHGGGESPAQKINSGGGAD